MKVTEILKENKQGLNELKDAIENGEKPFIAAATGSASSYAWGDLEKLGWAKRHTRIISRREALVEQWWEYTGPNTIRAETFMGKKPVEMQAGDTTPKIEVDYS